MKRLTAALCALLVLLSGCTYAAVASRQEQESYALYFRERELSAAPGGDALRAEQAYLPDSVDRDDTLQVAQALMEELLDGPLDETLRSPFPAGTALLSLALEGGRAVVDLSSAYGTLSGVSLTLADYAIALTLAQLPEISEVRITVRGQELAYRASPRFRPRDVLFTTTEDVVSTVTAMLYFLDEAGSLAPVETEVELYEGDTQVSAVIKALEEGPEEKELRSVLPGAFRVKSAWLEEDVCYVNLSSAALPELTDEQALLTGMEALVRSLCSLESVEEVQFLVDGEFAQSYGAVPVEEPYTP